MEPTEKHREEAARCIRHCNCYNSNFHAVTSAASCLMLSRIPAAAAAAAVCACQARNNARMLVAGSLDMFSNTFFDAAVTVAATGET